MYTIMIRDHRFMVRTYFGSDGNVDFKSLFYKFLNLRVLLS